MMTMTMTKRGSSKRLSSSSSPVLLFRHLCHRKMTTLSLCLLVVTTIQTFNLLSAASPFFVDHRANKSSFLRRFRLGSNLTWTSSRAFCLSRGSDLCTFERTCGKFRRPIGGQIKGSHWIPVQDRFNDWIQIGSKSPNSLCLKYTDLAVPPRSPSWGTRAIPMEHKGHVFCCARDSKTMEKPVFLFKKKPRKPNRGMGGMGGGGGESAAVLGTPPTPPKMTPTTSPMNFRNNETYYVGGLSTNGCASLCLRERETGYKCVKFEYEEENRGCFIHSTERPLTEREGREIYERTDIAFGSCGKSGKSGPSYTDCVRSYAGSPTIDMLTVEGGIQYWSVPVTGQYKFKIAAPAGRQWIRGVGGYGVIVEGTFRLQQGTIIKILVGQQSDYAGNQRYVGGSGGTFIATINNFPLMVAGGGASSSQMLSANHDITDGNVKSPGKDASSAFDRWGHGGESGVGGQRGYTASGSGASGGGAGFHADALCYNNSENSWLVPAKAFTSPEEPGVGEEMYSDIDNSYNNGGFGGGGAAGDGGSGGGGGYSGGGGGPKRGWAGGGGSYNTGARGVATADNEGLGWVVVRYLGPGSTTEISPARRPATASDDETPTDAADVRRRDDEKAGDEGEEDETIPEVPYHRSKGNDSVVIPFEEEIVTTTISDEREEEGRVEDRPSNRDDKNFNPSVNDVVIQPPIVAQTPSSSSSASSADATTVSHSLSDKNDDDKNDDDNELLLMLGGENNEFPYAAPLPTVESILTAQTRDNGLPSSSVYLIALVCGLLAVTLLMVVVSAVFLRRCYFASKAKYEPPSPDFTTDSTSSHRQSQRTMNNNKKGGLEEGDYEEPWPDLTDVLSSSASKPTDATNIDRNDENHRHLQRNHLGNNNNVNNNNNNGHEAPLPRRNAQSSASVRSCDYSTGYTTISTLRSDDAPQNASPDIFIGGHLYCSISSARTGIPDDDEDEDDEGGGGRGGGGGGGGGTEEEDVAIPSIINPRGPNHHQHHHVMAGGGGGGGGFQSSVDQQHQQNVALLSCADDNSQFHTEEEEEDDEIHAREPSILTTHDSDPDDDDDDGSYASESDDDDDDLNDDDDDGDDRSNVSEEVTSDIDFHSFKPKQRNFQLNREVDENDDDDDDDDDYNSDESGSQDYAVPQDSVMCDNEFSARRKIKLNTERKKFGRSNNRLHPLQQQRQRQQQQKHSRKRTTDSSPTTSKSAKKSVDSASPPTFPSAVQRSKSYIVKSPIPGVARNPNKPKPRRSRSDPRQCQQCGSTSKQKDSPDNQEEKKNGCAATAAAAAAAAAALKDDESVVVATDSTTTSSSPGVVSGVASAFPSHSTAAALLLRTLPDPPSSCPPQQQQQQQQQPPQQYSANSSFGGYHNNINNNNSSVVAPSSNFGTMQSIDNSIHYACTDITDIIQKQLVNSKPQTPNSSRVKANEFPWEETVVNFSSASSSPSTLDPGSTSSSPPSSHRHVSTAAAAPNHFSNDPTNSYPQGPSGALPPGLVLGANLGGANFRANNASDGVFSTTPQQQQHHFPPKNFAFSQQPLLQPHHSQHLHHHHLPANDIPTATISQGSSGVKMRRAPYPNCPLPSPPAPLSESDLLSLTTSSSSRPNNNNNNSHVTSAREAAALRHSVLTAIENQLSA